jgi:hypothetical protein
MPELRFRIGGRGRPSLEGIAEFVTFHASNRAASIHGVSM